MSKSVKIKLWFITGLAENTPKGEKDISGE